jgi:hypothetical protein
MVTTKAREWDAAAADAKAEEFGEALRDIEEHHPEAIGELREAWRAAYMTAGHKRLARVLLGNGKTNGG